MTDDSSWSPQMRKWMRGLRSGRRKSAPFDPRKFYRPQNDPETHKAPPRIGQNRTLWKVREQTWSPQMAKWMGDAQRHGRRIMMAKTYSPITGAGVAYTTEDGFELYTDETGMIYFVEGWLPHG